MICNVTNIFILYHLEIKYFFGPKKKSVLIDVTMNMRNLSMSQVQKTLLAKSFPVSSKQVQKLLNSWNVFSHLDHCEFHKINFQVNRGNNYEIIHVKFIFLPL